MKDITVLSIYDRISVFHSLKPFLFSKKHGRRFHFTSDPDYVLNRDRNRTLILLRWFLKPDRVDLEFLKRVREKYDRIAFFNGNAGGAIHRPEVLPYVDLFYNKALFRDRSLYLQTFYGDELFSQYYHEKYGVVDDVPRIRQLPGSGDELKKLRLSWNIGVADFPNARHRQRAGVLSARLFGVRTARPFYHADFWKGAAKPEDPKPYSVNARMGAPAPKSIRYQRELIREKMEGNPIFLFGKVPQWQFNREIRQAKIIISPFGWGELCLRDYEAVYNRALLMKPDMSHLETWPDIFVPGETYVPFDWDATDLAEKAEHYLREDAERKRIIANAFDAYRGQLELLDERFEAAMTEIVEGRSDDHRVLGTAGSGKEQRLPEPR